MIETDWLTSEALRAMLEHLRRTRRIHHTLAGKRKLRLFVCACFRRVWELVPDPRTRAVIELAEKYAEGAADFGAFHDTVNLAVLAHADALGFGHWEGGEFVQPKDRDLPVNLGSVALGELVECGLSPDPWAAAQKTASKFGDLWKDGLVSLDLVSPPILAELLRDVFGNPFSPVVPDADWLDWHDGTVWKMARTIYNEYHFEDLPILADALEDAGCIEIDLLDHCRNGGIHSRGCWAVDLLLGKG